MADKIDARGLSCPQPVILTKRKIETLGKGAFEILVDTETSRENISRLAQQTGWNVEVKRVDDDYCLILKKN